MRLDWIDRWKGLLIILVVAGHVCGGACHLCDGSSRTAFSLLYKIIYMFHMPAFFWISGVCWKNKEGRFIDFARKKAERLLLPYFVFGILSVFLYLLTTPDGELFSVAQDNYYVNMGAKSVLQPFLSLLLGNGWPNGEGFRCNSVLWFLPAMFSVLCFYRIVDYFIKRRNLQLALAFSLLMLELLGNKYGKLILPFGLSCITWYCPFLIFGRWFGVHNESMCLPHGTRTYVFLSTICVFYCFLSWLEPNYYMRWGSSFWFIVFTMMAVIGVILSACVAKIIPWKLLARLGQASLGIMLLHKFFVIFFQVKLPVLAYMLQQSTVLFWLGNIVVLVVSVLLCYVITCFVIRYAPWTLGAFSKTKL